MRRDHDSSSLRAEYQGQATDIGYSSQGNSAYAGYKINEILVKHTGKDLETIKKDTDRDYFLSAVQAKRIRDY